MKKLISVCTPAYNESDAIEELARRLSAVFATLADRYDFEVIVCENGSVDDTYEKLLRINARDPRFKVVRLARNFFPEGALTAALTYARGDAAILMYSDLQDPPEYIPAFLEKWEQGYKNVYAIVAKRSGESRFRRMLAHGYYWLVDRLSESPVPRNVSDFRLIDRAAYETYLRMPERYRVMRFMWPWMGFKAIGIEVERPARVGGSSSFRFFWTFHSALRTILAQTRTPLIVIPTFGLSCAAISLALFVVEVVRALVWGVPFDGYGTIVALMLLLFGLLFGFLWMISEYVGLIYEEVRHRPIYVVAQTNGLDGRAPADREQHVVVPRPPLTPSKS